MMRLEVRSGDILQVWLVEDMGLEIVLVRLRYGLNCR